MAALNEFQKHYRQRDMAAREWKCKGGRVVGYLCDSVPDELILAAGFLPYRISGNLDGKTDLADCYEQTVGFEGFVKTMLNMLLSGYYDFLDFLVIPHARASIHQLYPILAELKENDPSAPFPYPYFIDMAHTTFLTSMLYNRDRLMTFKNQLEKWSGEKISVASMVRAVAVGNENKQLLQKIFSLRVADPPCLSGVEALQLIGSSLWMPKEQHNRLLKAFLQETSTLAPRRGVRLFVQSSPIDDLYLYQLIEACGATVVDEGHCWGSRNAVLPVENLDDPLEAIIDRYQFKPPCSHIHPMTRRRDNLLKQVADADAQGVIFYIQAEDAQAWEVYEQTRALEEKGIPCLCLRQQTDRSTDPDVLQKKIRDFVATLADRLAG